MTLRRKPAWGRRLFHTLIGSLALWGLLVLTLGFSPLSQWLVARWQVAPDVQTAEAIVVLGGGASAEGLHLHSSARLFHAMLLYRQDLAPVVAFTGGSVHTPEKHAEGAAFLRAWETFGLPVTATVVDTAALNTYQNAVRVREKLGGPQRILLVTSSGHMRRARDTFEKQGFEVLPAPLPPRSPRFQHPAARWSAAAGLLYEVAAWTSYRLRGRI